MRSVRRQQYAFTGQGKAGASFTHANVIAEQGGEMEITVSDLGNNAVITLSFRNASGGSVLEERFTGNEARRLRNIPAGTYNMVVTINTANGNQKYRVDLRMPEIVTLTFAEEEIPLGTPDIGSQQRMNRFVVYGLSMLWSFVAGYGISLIVNKKRGNKAKDAA